MILMIDNYDSFTYNLVQYLGELGADVRVYRNDQITVAEIERLAPDEDRHLARPMHPHGGRHLLRGHSAVCRTRALTRCLSRSSVYW